MGTDTRAASPVSTKNLPVRFGEKRARLLPFSRARGTLLIMKKFARAIGGSLLTLAFIFGISVASSNTAEAQYRNDGQYRRHDHDNDNDRNRRDWRRYRNRDRDHDRDWDRQSRNRRYDNYGRYGNYGTYGGFGNYRGYKNRNFNPGKNKCTTHRSREQRRGQSYSPQRSHWWRDARTQAFRQGFERGYDQGYRQYAGYRNDRYGRSNTGILGGIFGRRY